MQFPVAAPAPAPLPPEMGGPVASNDHPTHVRHYRIEELLSGGSRSSDESEVYRAWDERRECPVALKRLAPSSAKDRKARLRFRREASAAARLRHPSVVPLLDLIETDDGDWIVMEFVEGVPLGEILEDEGPMAPERLLPLAWQIAEGLQEAHGKGVIHRDLRVGNILVTADGKARILDFGLAKDLWQEDSTSTTLTVDGVMLGRCRGMSPEQAMGLLIDPRSDLFALGSLLYEALTGECPFEADSPLGIAVNLLRKPHESLAVRLPGIPSGLAALIDDLLAKEPGNRPASAREVTLRLACLLPRARMCA